MMLKGGTGLQWPNIATICGMVVAAYIFGRFVTVAPSVESDHHKAGRAEVTCAWDKLVDSVKSCQNFECVGRLLDSEMKQSQGGEDKEPTSVETKQ